MAGEVFDARPRNGASYVVDDMSVPLVHVMVSALSADTVRRCLDDEVVVFREQDMRWTWRTFTKQADVLAAGLHTLGFERGDHTGTWSPNRVEWVFTQFATARLGLIPVDINPAHRLLELEYALNKVGRKAIVAVEAFKTPRYLEILQTLVPELVTVQPGALNAAKLPALRWVIRMGEAGTPGMPNPADVVVRGKSVPVNALDVIMATLSPDDTVNIQFASGTIDAPKGATLMHVNIVNNARFVVMAINLQEGDRLCIPVPLYHCFSMAISVLTCTATGACMAFPGEAFDPLVMLCTVAEECCTQLHGVPTMFIAQLGHPNFKSFDASTLRGGIMAGPPCPTEVMKRAVSELNLHEVTIAYGVIETSPVSFQNVVMDLLDKRVTTVGRTQPRLQVELVDGAGEVVLVGKKGELCTKGYSVMLGCWDDEAKTVEPIRDSWMRTGDLATFDVEDYCNIVGRAKDMLIRGSENVYPREIEEFPLRHPEMQAVNVFGVPDLKYGEEVCAWIVLKPGRQTTEEEIRTFCQGQIAYYKILCYTRSVIEMSMMVTGKAQKFVMRDRMVEELKLTVTATI